MSLSEEQIRKEKIDPVLERTGWRKEYIKEEINSVKSNFKTKEYTRSINRSFNLPTIKSI